MHEYGKTDWELLWEKLEQSGNVGIDYVINPTLYPRIISFLARHPKSLVVDFGCGTNFMGVQLLFGYTQSIPALQTNPDIGKARFNTLLYLGVEGSQELVDQSNRYLRDIGNPANIATIQSHIGTEFNLFDEDTVNLCVSRNFLMHLSAEEFSSHMSYVAKILKPDSCYIFTTLNPEYECKKAGKELINGERYDFMHGKSGEHGTFYHFYKDLDFITRTITEYFTTEDIVDCRPISDSHRDTHSRYYDSIPMAHTYVLKKKSNPS